VAATAALLNWQSWRQVKPGLDISWQSGTALAFTHHLQWGPALDFTYGPYGFAGFIEPFFRLTTMISIAYVFAITWLIAGLLVTGLRKCWGLGAAGFIAWAVLALSWEVVRTADFASVAGLGLALAVLQVQRTTLRSALTVLLGALAGFVLLVKADTGVTVVGLLVLAVAGAEGPWRERLRLAAQGGVPLVGAFAIAWAAAGQSFSNLASFFHASVSLALGYSAAMAGHLGPGIAWWALAISVVAGSIFAVTFRNRPHRYQLFASLMVLGWGWATVKDGFVAGNHFPGFFRLVLAAIALACIAHPPRALYASALALAACITLAAVQLPTVDPLGSLHALGTQVADVIVPGRFAHAQAAARTNVLKREPLSESALALLRGHTVAIEPWEDIVAWADPDISWDPEPVVQSYSAFTDYTDQLDATFLASSQAPQLVLYWPLRFSFDFRDPFMDPPATTEALYCHYVQIAVLGHWRALRHVPDRCGPAAAIGKAQAHFGQPVNVPSAPGEMVVANFSLHLPLLSRLDAVVLKPPNTYLTVWGRGGRPVRYRFVTGTSGDDHVLSVPAALGYSASLEPGTVRRVEISGGGWGTGQGSVVVTFHAVPMS
jgi:hypothetical protein